MKLLKGKRLELVWLVCYQPELRLWCTIRLFAGQLSGLEGKLSALESKETFAEASGGALVCLGPSEPIVGLMALNGPSCNTDQGVHHCCECLGGKPIREMKVKAMKPEGGNSIRPLGLR